MPGRHNEKGQATQAHPRYFNQNLISQKDINTSTLSALDKIWLFLAHMSEAGLVCVNGVSESLFKIGLCLPSGPMLTDEDLAYIVETIKKANK